jgi:hypothetical protein
MKIAPEKIVYVSCNSATQARFSLDGWENKVTRVRPVDMFPQTHHVENVLLEKIGLSLEVKSLPYWNLILLIGIWTFKNWIVRFYEKIILLLFVIVYSFSSCEKDDICDANTVTTSRLVISFYDVTNSAILKNVTNLK